MATTNKENQPFAGVERWGFFLTIKIVTDYERRGL